MATATVHDNGMEKKYEFVMQISSERSTTAVAALCENRRTNRAWESVDRADSMSTAMKSGGAIGMKGILAASKKTVTRVVFRFGKNEFIKKPMDALVNVDQNFIICSLSRERLPSECFPEFGPYRLQRMSQQQTGALDKQVTTSDITSDKYHLVSMPDHYRKNSKYETSMKLSLEDTLGKYDFDQQAICIDSVVFRHLQSSTYEPGRQDLPRLRLLFKLRSKHKLQPGGLSLSSQGVNYPADVPELLEGGNKVKLSRSITFNSLLITARTANNA
ncbi:hypothetical protein K435DRAFT_808670 [Dendrothele bispora CBS 962.96]|uniref:Uncharacterized protein n=1 Tax=Dendrothele bispora (strain CBS 962.96) TaxID=1314807 RepID=A0A4V4HC54_DENBC|nr:hypothetical protein K435DRAFT_808670 [Dendrothele bispora CBS 962.96]